MYCGKCGFQINDGDFFCTNCGEKIKENIPTTQIQNEIELKTENTTKIESNHSLSTAWLDFITILWGIIGVLNIILGFIGLFTTISETFIEDILYIISGTISFLTLYFVHTRSKSGYYFFIYMLIINGVSSIFNTIIEQYNNDDLVSIFIGAMLGVCLFVSLNFIYITKRKCLFLQNNEKYFGENIFYFALIFSLFLLCASFIFVCSTL